MNLLNKPKIKTCITAALLVFVAASVAAPIARRGFVRREGTASLDPADAAPSKPEALVVYFFRGNVRCTACRMLEACSREVVETRFPAGAADGRIAWRAIDYQLPGDEHWSADYQLLTGGVVLAEFHDGLRGRWTALPETWNMTGDRAGLLNYLEARIRAFQAALQEDRSP